MEWDMTQQYNTKFNKYTVLDKLCVLKYMFCAFVSHSAILQCNFITNLLRRNRGSLNMKMSSYQYRDYHYKDKTVWRPSYLYNANPHTWKDRLNI